MKIFLITITFLGFFAQYLCAETPKIQTRELSSKELKKQNMTVASMAAEALSKSLPQKIDKFTILRSVKNDGSILIYTFEINTGAKSDVSIIKEDHSRMKKAVTRGICQTSKPFLLAGINISYRYVNFKTKKLLFEFNITQNKCAYLNKK